MDVACPYCGRQLRSAEDVSGREVQCPGCATTFTAPAAAALVAEKIADAPPPAAADDYFAEVPAVAPRPPAGPERDEDDEVPEEEIRPSRRPMRWRPNLAVAEDRVRGPAIALMVLSGLGAAWGLVAPLLQTGMYATGPGGGPPVEVVLMNVGSGLLSVAYNGFIFWAAWRMKRLKGHGTATAGAIMTIIPCFSVCCLAGIPLGVWALRALGDPDVKDSFT